MSNWHELWDGLAKSGWLSDLGKGRALELKAELETNQDEGLGSVQTRLADLRLDVECIFDPKGGKGPYVSILEQYAEASRDRFHPSDLFDELDSIARTARVSFRHDGRDYRCEVPWHDDFFRDEVHDLINQALEDSEVEQRFVFLPADESGDLLLALIRPQVLEDAHQLGILPESDLELLEESIAKGADIAQTELFGASADGVSED